MRVEYNFETIKPERKKKKKRLSPHFFIFLLMIIASVFIALSLTIWFNVNTFSVSGNSIYSDEDIIAVMGVSKGDNLWRVPVSNIEKRIEQQLPFVASAKIIRKMPGTLSVKITGAKEYAFLKTEFGGVVVDENFKILKTATEKPDGLLNIKGMDILSSNVGDKLGVVIEEKYKLYNEFVTKLENNGFGANGNYKITTIDVNDDLNLKFVIDNRLCVIVGSLNNLDNKLIHLKSSMSKIDGQATAKIDISSWDKDNKKSTLTYQDIEQYK